MGSLSATSDKYAGYREKNYCDNDNKLLLITKMLLNGNSIFVWNAKLVVTALHSIHIIKICLCGLLGKTDSHLIHWLPVAHTTNGNTYIFKRITVLRIIHIMCSY